MYVECGSTQFYTAYNKYSDVFVIIFFHQYDVLFQMKKQYKEIIMKAMPLIISDLEVDVLFLYEFEEHKLFGRTSVQQIMVRVNKSRFVLVDHFKIGILIDEHHDLNSSV